MVKWRFGKQIAYQQLVGTQPDTTYRCKTTTYDLSTEFLCPFQQRCKRKAKHRPERKDAEKCTGYALLDGFVPADHPKSSGTTPDFTATTDWQLMEYVFDLSKMATTIWSPTSGTTTEEEANESIANYIQEVTNEELWKNAYLIMWNETANSTLEIDNVIFEPIDTYTEIQNPGFESNTLLPIMVAAEPAPGARSGQWVVVNKRGGEMNLSIDEEDAFEGKRSMKLETVKAASYPRMDQYMAMDIYEVPEGNYTFDLQPKPLKKVLLFVYTYMFTPISRTFMADNR